MIDLKKFNSEVMDILESVVVALVAVMIIFSLICRVYVVDGSSMKPTLTHGDRLLVSQLFYQPKQGDIVCLVAEGYGDKVLVKRVIATAGQTIDINGDNKVTIDGAVIDEPYVDLIVDEVLTTGNQLRYDDADTAKGTFQLPYTVKEGEVFVMGDNRDGSLDSRDDRVGPVSENYILGKMLFRIFPNTGVVK